MFFAFSESRNIFILFIQDVWLFQNATVMIFDTDDDKNVASIPKVWQLRVWFFDVLLILGPPVMKKDRALSLFPKKGS